MFTASDVVLGGLLPAAVAAVLMVVAHRFRWRPTTAWAISLAAGCVVGQLGLAAQNGFGQAIGNAIRPRVAHDWLPLLLSAAAAVAIVAGTGRRRVAAGLAVAACIAAPMLFLWRSIYVQQVWSAVETAAWLSLLTVALMVVWTLLASPRPDSEPFIRATLLIFVALGTVGVLGMSGSFSYAQLAGASAAAMVGTTFGCHWLCQCLAGSCIDTGGASGAPRHRYLEGLGGAAGVVTLTVGSLLVLGYFYADLSAFNAVLLAVALTAGGGWLPVGKPVNRAWQIGLRTLACLVPLATAVILAYRAFAAAI